MGIKKVIQFRYFSDYYYPKNTNDYNYPINLCSDDLSLANESNVFNKFNNKILLLRIQTLPGVKFYLNTDLDPYIVGASGVYQIDELHNKSVNLPPLRFSSESLDYISKNPDGFLIIDILYEEG